MKTLTTIAAIGCTAICGGFWRAWTGAEALIKDLANPTNTAALFELIRIYCLGPLILLLSLLMAPFCKHCGKRLPILLSVGILAGAWGLWNSSFFAHEVGHALFNECGDTFSAQLQTYWGVGIGAAVAMLILHFWFPSRLAPSRKETANKPVGATARSPLVESEPIPPTHHL